MRPNIICLFRIERITSAVSASAHKRGVRRLLVARCDNANRVVWIARKGYSRYARRWRHEVVDGNEIGSGVSGWVLTDDLHN